MTSEPGVDAGLVEVLAAHHRGDWSDGTYSCLGCRARAEEEIEAADELPTREQMSAFKALSHPGWTRADYYAHLARAVQAYTEQRADERVAEARYEGVAAGIKVVVEHLNAVEPSRIKPWVREQAPTTGGGE